MKYKYYPTYSQKQAEIMSDILLTIIGPDVDEKMKKKKREGLESGLLTQAYYQNNWRQQAAYKGMMAVLKLK